ncbi:MAG: hypothetical protein AAF725_24900 [Acidobacteriota bacterium]
MILTSRSSQNLLLTASWLCLAFRAAAGLAQAPPAPERPAIEIAHVTSDGVDFTVALNRPRPLGPEASDSAPDQRWTLSLLGGRDDQILAKTTLTPADLEASSSFVLKADLESLARRGWQHAVEIRSRDKVLDRMDLRLQLDCPEAGAEPCTLSALPGWKLTGAVRMGRELGAALESGLEIEEMLASPDLRGPLIEAAVDLQQIAVSGAGHCTCFYTANVSPFGGASHAVAQLVLEAHQDPNTGETVALPSLRSFGDELLATDDRLIMTYETERTVRVDFGCFTITPAQTVHVTTQRGALQQVGLPALEPCEKACDGPVDWRLRDFSSLMVLISSGWAEAFASHEMEWRIAADLSGLADPGSLSSSLGDSRRARGTQYAPWILDSFIEFPTATESRMAPAVGRLTSRSLADIQDWSPTQRPGAKASAGAAIEAEGVSSCGPSFYLMAEPTLWNPAMTPSVLDIEVISEVEEDP